MGRETHVPAASPSPEPLGWPLIIFPQPGKRGLINEQHWANHVHSAGDCIASWHRWCCSHNLRGPLHSLPHRYKQLTSAESLELLTTGWAMGKETGILTGISGLWDVPPCSWHSSFPTSFLCVLPALPFTHYPLPLLISFSPQFLKLHSWFSVTD